MCANCLAMLFAYLLIFSVKILYLFSYCHQFAETFFFKLRELSHLPCIVKDALFRYLLLILKIVTDQHFACLYGSIY